MTKNEIVTRWLLPKRLIIKDHNFDDYNLLHEAWVKFRDLKIESYPETWQHMAFKTRIADKIAFGTITEAFDELVKGIEWYESLNKKA